MSRVHVYIAVASVFSRDKQHLMENGWCDINNYLPVNVVFMCKMVMKINDLKVKLRFFVLLVCPAIEYGFIQYYLCNPYSVTCVHVIVRIHTSFHVKESLWLCMSNNISVNCWIFKWFVEGDHLKQFCWM